MHRSLKSSSLVALTAVVAGLLVVAAPGSGAQAQIPGPFFCANRSLGGPQTYAFDSNGDGVADTCSLRDTRRATVARQNALETLAGLFPGIYLNALHGMVDDPDTPDVDESTEGSCASAPDDLGDSEDDLADDVCGLADRFEDPERVISPPPAPIDPTKAEVFFSGIITGPNFCANRSLGGPVTYPFDVNGDGVAGICSLPYTRREAVARQNALEEAFSDHPQYEPALALACATLGTIDFGDHPDDLVTDSCNPPPDPPRARQPPSHPLPLSPAITCCSIPCPCYIELIHLPLINPLRGSSE